MRILLMPPMGGGYSSSDAPRLGLGYLATSLLRNGHEVRLLLKGVKDMTPETFKATITDFRPRLLGLSVVSGAVKRANDTARIAKETDPSVCVVMGGPHPSSDSENYLFHDMPSIDYAFTGEAELSLIQFTDQLAHSKGGAIPDPNAVPGLIYRSNGGVVRNPALFPNDLDALGFPAWDLMPPSEFTHGTVDAFCKGAPVASVILTRGCPFRCTFCTPINGHKVRKRSVANIMEELNMLHNRFGAREFQFIDSNATADKQLLLGVCQGIIEQGLDIHWCCPNGIRLNTVDEELATWMKKSGCYEVNVGVESGSPRILKKIKKAITVEQVKEKVSLLRRVGIDVVGLFIFGFPGETREEMKMTFDLARYRDFFRGQFFILNPLPGTELYEELLDGGRISRPDWTRTDYLHYENNLSELTPTELRSFVKKVFWAIHLSPARIPRILKRINSWGNLKMALRWGWYRLTQ